MKEKRQKITKLLIDTELYNLEGNFDNFIDRMLNAKEEAKRENFDVITVNFGVDIVGIDNDYVPHMEVEASRLETIQEMKLRIAAEEARHKREEQETHDKVMEKYKDHD